MGFSELIFSDKNKLICDTGFETKMEFTMSIII